MYLKKQDKKTIYLFILFLLLFSFFFFLPKKVVAQRTLEQAEATILVDGRLKSDIEVLTLGGIPLDRKDCNNERTDCKAEDFEEDDFHFYDVFITEEMNFFVKFKREGETDSLQKSIEPDINEGEKVVYLLYAYEGGDGKESVDIKRIITFTDDGRSNEINPYESFEFDTGARVNISFVVDASVEEEMIEGTQVLVKKREELSAVDTPLPLIAPAINEFPKCEGKEVCESVETLKSAIIHREDYILDDLTANYTFEYFPEDENNKRGFVTNVSNGEKLVMLVRMNDDGTGIVIKELGRVDKDGSIIKNTLAYVEVYGPINSNTGIEGCAGRMNCVDCVARYRSSDGQVVDKLTNVLGQRGVDDLTTFPNNYQGASIFLDKIRNGVVVGSGEGAQIVYTNNVYTALGCWDTSQDGTIVRLMQLGIGISGGLILMRAAQGLAKLGNAKEPEGYKDAMEMIWGAVLALIMILFGAVGLRFLGVNVFRVLPPGTIEIVDA